eukprot:7177212-Pyramimonas_sp.AAC.1
MARLEADPVGLNAPTFHILAPILFRALGWYFPSSPTTATAEPPDAPHPTTARPTRGSNAQPWALG